MYDDGLHADGAAGDGVYATPLKLGQHIQLQYYIYAEYDAIASVSPARAEYEFYSLQLSRDKVNPGELQLNEIMPSNVDYVTDESGDYEDWFEIYNTTDHPISCFGLYASDNSDNKLKWSFPDTSIPAKSFLIVWADEDGKDPGLHANFKLSKSGERVLLYHSDSSLIDSVSFPEIKDNQSYAYCPVQKQWKQSTVPTFNVANNCEVGNESLNINNILFYPNPFNDQILISCPVAISDVKVNCMNALGQILAAPLNTHSNLIELNTHSWPPGIYYIQLRLNQQLLVSKIIKQ